MQRLLIRASTMCILCAAVVSSFAAFTGLSTAMAQDRLFDADKPLELADQGSFVVPGRYVDVGKDTIMVGQMFVQFQVPKNKTRPYPIVMIHGGGQTGVNFLGTPDGRRGWADDFVAHGYAVYVVDQSGRGRSGFFTDVYGKTRKSTVANVTRRFTSPETEKLWPQAEKHTQWPGTGKPGDPVFDEFNATQVETIGDEAMIEQLNRAAVAKLLDRIGPAVLLTHSQAGVIGWAAADERPHLVKGILAVEPSGPPIHENVASGAPDFFGDGPVTRPFGVTRGPMTYDPPIKDAAELKLVRQEKPDAPDLVRCFEQAAPARKLPHLAGIPILILTSEASYHAPYDHCTAKWLTQAGVKNDFIRLLDHGIRGNGHMMMLEKNNLQIAEFIRSWEAEHVR
ncbi:MAG TPA: alpha/beta hydrolase [Pseudolabrys sp.]|nr:alpha/beta hydrolase [Pseudolabrys sp.]